MEALHPCTVMNVSLASITDSQPKDSKDIYQYISITARYPIR